MKKLKSMSELQITPPRRRSKASGEVTRKSRRALAKTNPKLMEYLSRLDTKLDRSKIKNRT